MKKEVSQDSSLTNETPVEEISTNEPKVESNSSPEKEIIQENEPSKNNIFNKITNKIKGFGIKKVIVIATVAILLIALVTIKVVTSTPKHAFKSAISDFYKETSKYLKELDDTYEKFNLEKEPVIANIELTADSNIEDVISSTKELGIELKDITIKGSLGLDLDKKEMLFGGSLKGESEEIDLDILYKESAAYITSNLFDEVVKVEDDYSSPFYDIQDIVDQINLDGKVDFKVYDSILKSFTTALNDSLDSDAMEKESEKIDIVDKEVKVTKNSYELDDKALSDIIRSVADQLLEDDDFISNLSDMIDVDKSEIKDALKDLKKEAKDIEFDDTFVINVYTRGVLNTFAGISLEVEKEEYFSWYTDGKNTEINVDNNSEGYDETNLNIKATKDGKETNVKVKYNGDEIAELNFKELTDEVVDLEFTIKEEKEVIAQGKFYFTLKENKNSLSGDYEMRLEKDEEYLSLKGNYEIVSTDKLTDIDTSKAVSEDELDEEEILTKIEEISKKDKVFASLYDSIYESSLDLDYYDMVALYYIDDVKEILKNNKGTVLYVGSQSYAYGTETSIFNNLTEAQEEYDFHTYYYSQYYIDNEFRSLVSGVTPICNTAQDATTAETTPSCNEYPTVYFIKDGKIIAAVQNSITKDELAKYLKEIGLA